MSNYALSSDAGIRLAKRVAELRACSRRQAEALIEAGAVRVDGQVVRLPQFRVVAQAIAFDSDTSLLALRAVTLLLNKPADLDEGWDLLQADARFQADASPLGFSRRHLHKLSCPVPLETAASGLMVFTQDGRILRKLIEDAALLEQEFTVMVEGDASAAAIGKLNQNQGLKVSLGSQADGISGLRFAFKGWQMGRIAMCCERVSLRILSIRRLRIGRVNLGQVPTGQWRYLLDHEKF